MVQLTVLPWGESALLRSALHYASCGIEVLPVKAGTKEPLTQHGFHDATTDEEVIREWWARWPTANVGGRPRGLGLVLDVDPRNGGDIGYANWEADHGCHDTATAATGGGGRHVWFACGPVKNTKYGQGDRYVGIDIISATGYVIMPPSQHPSGGRYDWLDTEELMPEVAPLPSSFSMPERYEAPWNKAKREHALTPAPKAQMLDVKRALGHMDPDMDYADWIAVGQAVHSQCWEEGFDLWAEWSKGGMKYPGLNEVARKWHSFDADGQTGLGTLFHMAGQAGYNAPKAAVVPPRDENLNVPFLVGNAESWDSVRKADELVADLIEADALGVFYGPPGGGKTFFSMAIGMHVARGVPFCGHAVKQGPVVYVCGEGGSGVHTRRKAWLWDQGYRAPPTDDEFPFYQTRHTVYFAEPTSLAPLADALREIGGVKLLIIDTLARTFTGSENDSADMTAWVQALDALRAEFKCTIIVVHHTGKDIELGARGSTVLRGAADFEFLVQDDSGFTTAENRKQRNSETGGVMAFQRLTVEFADADGVPTTSVVLRETERKPISETMTTTGTQREVLAAIIELVNQTRANLDEQGRETERASASRKMLSEILADMKPDTVKKAVQRLVKDGAIEADRHTIWLPE